MADPHHAPADHDAYERGSMEIEEQKATWELFGALTKWGSLAVAALVLLLTVWFMPNGGFVPAAISAIVVSAVGWWFLRDKPAAH